MKKILYPFLFGLLLFSACQKDLLNKQPLDIISDNVVWSDPVLIDGFLTQLYAQTTVFVNEAPNYAFDGGSDNNAFSELTIGPFWVNEIADEGTWGWGFYTQGFTYKYGGLNIGGGLLEYWELPYRNIRSLNEFIQRVRNAPIDETTRKVRIAEARFLRAFNYFAMVKRYGGVPLIIVPQKIDDPKATLYPARDSEQKIYDFVISEADSIAADLPEANTVSDNGRPTKYVALALKCRAALYAGSIAQFGTVQLSGLLGIPSSTSAAYYQQSYDAAKAIINSGKYALYNADANKVMNFRNIFLVKNNPEVIFAKRHNAADAYDGGNGWSYDFCQCPKPQAWDAGNKNAPYLEMAEEFEHVDGTPGTLDRVAIQQGLWTTDQLWGNKDPRFYATLYTMNTPWQGTLVDPHNGILLPDGSIQIDGSYNGILALGTQKVDGSFRTSFGVMKYLDENADNNDDYHKSSTDYLVFRYGEILLNLAEASLELGNAGEALDAINQVRTRAGIAILAVINREEIRHERKVELAFEGHRYWDLRRWRTAESALTTNWSGLRYILDYTTRKYKLEVIENFHGLVNPPKFLHWNYYFPITLARTGNNPNLVENPGY